MNFSFEGSDPMFLGAGTGSGLEVWCIERLQVVPVPKSSYGKFYSGSAYIILNSVNSKSGVLHHEIHYWLGRNTSKEDLALASDKALELDAALGSCTVQYRELQGQETEKFLSYFKPCIIPVEGVYSSQQGNLNSENYQIRLLRCKGDRVVHVQEVPFSRSSLTHNDVFVLDTASKIFLFSGCNTTIQERAKALEVVQYIKEDKHGQNCDVATIEDGKFVGDPDAGEFWHLFGGYAPIPRDSPSVQQQPDPSSVKLFWINLQGKLSQHGTQYLHKKMLETDKCYMLDSDSEIFVWMGKCTSVTERKTSISAVEDFLRSQERSTRSHLSLLTEGLESTVFKAYFEGWPHVLEPKLYEDGRGKVAGLALFVQNLVKISYKIMSGKAFFIAIFKHHGYDVKELPEEDYQLYHDVKGKLKVWRVDGDRLHLLSAPEQRKLFSGECYILQYTFPGSDRDENIFYSWIGRRSVMIDRNSAISHMSDKIDSTRKDAVVAKIIEGKEPAHFFLVLETLITFKGGKSTQYKTHVEEQGNLDDTYDENKSALFQVRGTNPNSMQAIQVDLVSSSLNSSYCYILQTEIFVFTWIGTLTSTRDHDTLDEMLELLNPTWQPISVREGSEPDDFWNVLGGKTEYPKQKEIKDSIENPRLFVLNITKDDFKVKEIYSFTQDDLTTEDVLVLDCGNEIYVWVGCHSNVASKKALVYGQKFLEADVLIEGTSVETPIYVIPEGREPQFFTQYFSWDHRKANMHGNSFERKLANLKGKSQNLEIPSRNSRKSFSPETTPNGFKSVSAISNGRERGLFPSLSYSGSIYSSPDKQTISNSTSLVGKLYSGSFPDNAEPQAKDSPSPHFEEHDTRDSEISLTYPYERLNVSSKDPVKDIDVTKREAYLSEEEFVERFGMKRRDFYQLPKWKRNKLKISVNLF